LEPKLQATGDPAETPAKREKNNGAIIISGGTTKLTAGPLWRPRQ
jgi:hypothetical protein